MRPLGANPSYLGQVSFKKVNFDLFVATKCWLSEWLEDWQVLEELFTPLHWFTLLSDLD